MRVKQVTIDEARDWARLDPLQALKPQCLLIFGAVPFFEPPHALYSALKSRFPTALLVGCTTAGEIASSGVEDETCTVTALSFEHTRLQAACTQIAGMDDSQAAGERLGAELAAPDLRAVLVFGPGVQVNGSALVAGLAARVGEGVQVSGGLAGDHGQFRQTYTFTPRGVADRGAVALGLYGEAVRVGHGSVGGWQPFGPARQVTRAAGNLLYELDGEPALAIYKRYLGSYADGLPGSGLLFPFAVQQSGGEAGLIRTILGVDEAQGSLVLAGDVAQGATLRLMQARTDGLVNGARDAAELARGASVPTDSALALLVSCVGRKLVMGDRVAEEVEAVAEAMGPGVVLSGFYSNGEIGPARSGCTSLLHNQTMTITLIEEVLEA